MVWNLVEAQGLSDLLLSIFVLSLLAENRHSFTLCTFNYGNILV